MAIIVDKEQKKRDIALSSKDLILEKGINNITISQIAKSAKIGKGTVYEYFKNKEEIVFELVNILMQKHNEEKSKRLNLQISTRQKIKEFFSFFYKEEDKELRQIYKQFTSIALISRKEEMIAFQTECFNYYQKWMEEIIDEAISKNELSKNAKKFIIGLFAYSQGIFIMSVTTDTITDLQQEINSQIDILFDLMEAKS